MELKEAGLVGVKVSIDSSKPSKHDFLRGCTGSWNNAITAIKNAKTFGLETMINYTIDVHNIDEYKDMLEFGDILGCIASTHFIMPVGKGKNYHNQYNMSTIIQNKQKKIIENLHGDLYCTAASDMIAINVNGDIRVCLFEKILKM